MSRNTNNSWTAFTPPSGKTITNYSLENNGVEVIEVGNVLVANSLLINDDLAINMRVRAKYNDNSYSAYSNVQTIAAASVANTKLVLGGVNNILLETIFSDTETVEYEWTVGDIVDAASLGCMITTKGTNSGVTGSIREYETDGQYQLHLKAPITSSTASNGVMASGYRFRLVRRQNGADFFINTGGGFVLVPFLNSNPANPVDFVHLSVAMVFGGNGYNLTAYKKNFSLQDLTTKVGAGAIESYDLGQSGIWNNTTKVLVLTGSLGTTIELCSGLGTGVTESNIRASQIALP